MKSIWPTDVNLAQGISPGTIKVTEVDSTMRYLASKLENNPALEPFTTVVADHQWAGKGRFARRWADTPGDSVLMSVLVDCPTNLSQWVPLLAGVSAADALQGVNALVKWPNDVMVHGHKVAGILCELAAVQGDLARVIVGLGLNVTQVPNGAPQTAGSVVSGSSQPMSHLEKSALAVQIADSFLTQLHQLLSFADADVWRQEFLARLYGVGQVASVTLSSGRLIQGINRGIDINGALLIDSATHGQESHLVRVTSGDVAVLEKKTEGR